MAFYNVTEAPLPGRSGRPGCDLSSFFRIADPEFQRAFSEMARARNFAKGQSILEQDGAAICVGHIHRGSVKIAKVSLSGQSLIAGFLHSSDFFGRPFARRTQFSYEAATDVEASIIAQRDFERLLARFPYVKRNFLRLALDELDVTRLWQVIVNRHTAIERVAVFLCVLLLRHSPRQPHSPFERRSITFSIDRNDIADFLGIRPETLCRNLKSMVRRGILDFEATNQFGLLDEGALVDLTGERIEDLVALAGLRAIDPTSEM